jgi:hypothetical protein
MSNCDSSRSERTPAEYVPRILGSICGSYVDYGLAKDDDEFDDIIFARARALVDEGMHPAETLELKLAGRLEPFSENTDLRKAWAFIGCALCLEALQALEREEVNVAWTYVLDAMQASETFFHFVVAEPLSRSVRAQVAKRGAAARLANSPVQAAKYEAFPHWEDWQSGKTVHKSGAAFHRYIVKMFPVITDTKTVERWCKRWREESKKRD